MGEQFVTVYGSIAWHWYIIGHGDTDEYLVVDLDPANYGICYLTQHYFFGQKQFTTILGNSFATFLEKLLVTVDNLGERDWVWWSE